MKDSKSGRANADTARMIATQQTTRATIKNWHTEIVTTYGERGGQCNGGIFVIPSKSVSYCPLRTLI